MKKSIIAIAVSSAAFAAVSAHAAEDMTVGFYGDISYDYAANKNKDKDSKSAFEDNGSAVGFKGQSKINDSANAFFNVKYKIHADQKDSDAKLKMDKAYIGAKGNFGTVEVGAFSSIYSAITDPFDQFEYLNITNGTKTAKGDSFGYFTPSVSGFQLKLSAQSIGDGNSVHGKGDDLYKSKSGTSATAVLSYTNDLVTVSLGHDSLNNLDASKINDSTDYVKDSNGSTGLTVTFAPVENLSVSAKYEATDKVKKIFGLATRYGYGMGDLYGTYQKVDWVVADKKYDEYGLGITYNLNHSMYVYAEAGQNGNSEQTKQTAIGAQYSF